MTDTIINRAEELTALTVIAKEYPSTLSVSTTPRSMIITNDDNFETGELVIRLKQAGWLSTFQVHGRFNNCWYIHVQYNTSA